MINGMMLVGGAKKKIYKATAQLVLTQFGGGSGSNRIYPNPLPNGCPILQFESMNGSQFFLKIPIQYKCTRFFIDNYELLLREDSMQEQGDIRTYWCYDDPYFGQAYEAIRYIEKNIGKEIPIALEFA